MLREAPFGVVPGDQRARGLPFGGGRGYVGTDPPPAASATRWKPSSSVRSRDTRTTRRFGGGSLLGTAGIDSTELARDEPLLRFGGEAAHHPSMMDRFGDHDSAEADRDGDGPFGARRCLSIPSGVGPRLALYGASVPDGTDHGQGARGEHELLRETRRRRPWTTFPRGGDRVDGFAGHHAPHFSSVSRVMGATSSHAPASAGTHGASASGVALEGVFSHVTRRWHRRARLLRQTDSTAPYPKRLVAPCRTSPPTIPREGYIRRGESRRAGAPLGRVHFALTPCHPPFGAAVEDRAGYADRWKGPRFRSSSHACPIRVEQAGSWLRMVGANHPTHQCFRVSRPYTVSQPTRGSQGKAPRGNTQRTERRDALPSGSIAEGKTSTAPNPKGGFGMKQDRIDAGWSNTPRR